MKKLPLGIQSIRQILEEDKVYIDKTGFAFDLIENGKHYFISRPRRFGKSLFLSILEEIFKGDRELFKGLAIDRSHYDWKEYPVLSFDFARITSRTSIEFEDALKRRLQSMALALNLSIETPTIQEGLEALIINLSKNNRVAVLVDEYDSAIINNLKDPELAEKNRDLLKAFFATLKSLDRYIQFTFVTGVSKFSQVSLFSGPNHLTDITMDPRYAQIMGYTEEEVKESFREHVQKISQTKSEEGTLTSEEDVIDEIRTWYNGYRFSEKELAVYNPYSTLRYFNTHKAESYWYSTGTPSFLIDQVRRRPQSVVPLRGISALKSTLSDISSLEEIDLVALMYQTGYLTIRGYHPKTNAYDLDFPNKEVKEAFFHSLLKEFAKMDPLGVINLGEHVLKNLENFELEAFVEKINSHFAKIPYYVFQNAKEGFYQAVFFTLLEVSGMRAMAEIGTNIGRIDLIVEISEAICIFELKLDQGAEIALTQAETKRYRERFSETKQKTLVVGIKFSSKSRNISDWKGVLYLGAEKIKEIVPSH